MTEREALENISDFAIGISQEVSNLALGVAINALEKQIPKKPVLVNRSFTGVKARVCPSCSTRGHYVPLFSKLKYCDICGQKLDWSE